MSYGGTEMLGLTAAECRNPGKMIPLASKITILRIGFLYLLPLFLLGILVSSRDPKLTDDHHNSPFVIAAEKFGARRIADLFNATILFAIFSMANAAVFASSRAFLALCHKRMGPSWGRRVTKKGLPIGALGVTLALALLAYIGAVPGGREIFDWLLSLSGVLNYLSWFTICASHIRLRRALRAHSIAPEKALTWRSWTGEAGSWVGMASCLLSLLGLIGGAWPTDKTATRGFFRDILGIPVVVAMYVGYQVWHRVRHGH